jgi:hypothetical protein
MTMLIEPSPNARREYLTAMRFHAAVLVSLVLHALAFWEIQPILLPAPGAGDPNKPLDVRLAPAPAPAPPQEAPPPRAAARPAPPRARPAPPPAAPPPPVAPAPAVAAPTPVIRPAEPDLMAYVEARRRERATAEPEPRWEAPAPPRESENERASRAAAANLASSSAMVFGYDPSRSGGVFQVERLSADYAEISFVGWHAGARRQMKQVLEVRRGAHANIRIAVVRDIIAVIRKYEPEEFVWDSQRLGRSLTLSSRARDNAGLEDFMMLEFFSGPKPVHGAGR